ncbi:hypothetical protein LMG28138_03303 [Pararobbsia alpina]|uniref:Uncharacterized protein n=1 Tax=Pararobbsia alpina TaxID=621374 RepID=A0A6S7CKV4_9BURK|nr:hypothetical protein LMG28138_03303 [Pararobbsia alpina]
MVALRLAGRGFGGFGRQLWTADFLALQQSAPVDHSYPTFPEGRASLGGERRVHRGVPHSQANAAERGYSRV